MSTSDEKQPSANGIKPLVRRRKARISLTKVEIEALRDTAENMRDDLQYFNYKPKKEYEAFCKAYETALEKLAKALAELQ